MGRALVALIVFAGIVADNPAFAVDLSIGINGHFRIGQWTPVRITGLDIGPVVVRASDPTGTVVDYPLEEQDGEWAGVVQFANVESRCLILAGDDQDAVAAFRPRNVAIPHKLSERLWLTYPAPLGFDEAVSRYNSVGDPMDRASVSVVSEEQIASNRDLLSDALQAFNVVVLAAPASDAFAAALKSWVADGGHLVLVNGLESELDAPSPLFGWTPIRVAGPARFRDLNVLEAAVPGGKNLRIVRPIDGVKLETNAGSSAIKSVFGSILTRAPFGFGRVSALAVDLGDRVLQDWSSLDTLCLLLADEIPEPQVESRRERRRLASSGVGEFETQVLSIVDGSIGDSSGPPTLWNLLGRMCLYAIIIGGLDYIIVHRLIGRPQLTWLTMPLWVFAATYVAAGVNTQSIATIQSNKTLSVRSVALLDVDTDSGFSRQTTWSSIGVANRSRVEASLNKDFRVMPRASFDSSLNAKLGWLAIPESNFGGLYRSREVGLNGLRYAASGTRDAFTGIPVQPKGTRLVSTDASGFGETALKHADSPVELRITLNGTRPEGTIINRLDAPISEWSLAFERSIVQPRDSAVLEPNTPFRVDFDRCVVRSLRDALKGIQRFQIKEGDKVTSTRNIAESESYDVLGRDLATIALTATFHDRADGISYTGLRASAAPGGWDLSGQLEFDRVVFFGLAANDRQPINAAALTENNGLVERLPESQSPDSTTIIRVVAPITQ